MPQDAPTADNPPLGLYFGANAIVGALVLWLAGFAVDLDPFGWADALGLTGVILWTVMVFLAAPEAAGGARATSILDAPDRPTAYQRLMRPLIEGSARWLRIDTAPPLRARRVLAQSLNWRLLDAAMFYAVVYPISLIFLHWAATGMEGRLGSAVLLPALDDGRLRAAAFGGLALLIVLIALSRQAKAKNGGIGLWLSKSSPGIAAGVAGLLAIAVAVALAVAPAGAPAVALAVLLLSGLGLGFAVPNALGPTVYAPGGAIALALAVALSLAAAFALTLTLAVAGAGAFAVAGIVAVAGAASVAATAAAAGLIWLNQQIYRDRSGLGYFVFCAGIAEITLVAIVLLPWLETDSDARSLFLFLAVLPLLNALFDYASLGVTLTLIRLGYGRGWTAVLYGLLDGLFALLLFLASGCTLIAVVHGMNQTAGVEFVPLPALFADLGNWRQYWWVYAMVFSTVVPTLLHLLLAALSLLSWSPGGLKAPLLRLIAAARSQPVAMAAAPLALTALAAAWLAVAVAVIGGLAFLLLDLVFDIHDAGIEAMGDALRWYLGLFPRFAGWIGAI